MSLSQPATARATADFYEFGPFRVEASTRSLYRAGEYVALTPKLFETLLLLVEEAGRVVAKEQLMERVWPGVIVEEGSIANNISALRKILNPDFEGEGPIATNARYGYRLTADVRAGRNPVSERDTIVLADFENRTGDAVFDYALKQALRLDLEQSPFLNILSEQKVTATLLMMGRTRDQPVIGEIARELGQRADSKAFLAGSIFAVGDEYVVGLTAINCATGDTLVAEQARARGKSGVLKALDQAASAMRTRLGESLASVQKFSTPLEEATTSSLEALKAYSEGRRISLEGGDTPSIPFNLRAVELDPGFAVAYASLAISYDNLGQATRALEYGKKAYELRERVSERERHRLTAFYFTSGPGDMDKAIQAYELWKRSYPRDGVAFGNSASLFMRNGQWERALAAAEVAHRLEPTTAGVSNLALIQMALERHDDARRTLEQGLARKLDAYYIHLDLYCEAFLSGDREAMQRQMDWAVGRPGEEEWLLCAEADVEAHAGRLQKARQLSRRAIDSARRADAPETAALFQVEAALREAEFGNAAAAREGAMAALALAPGRDVTTYVALALARAGDVAKARQLTEGLDTDYPNNTPVQRYWLPTIRAAIEIQAKNPDEAVEILQLAAPLERGLSFPFEVGMMYPAYLRGEAHLMLGLGKDAAAEFRKFLDHPGIVKYFPLAALAHLGLARALALDGKLAESQLAYEGFFELWSGADPQVPVLQQAKAEYAT